MKHIYFLKLFMEFILYKMKKKKIKIKIKYNKLYYKTTTVSNSSLHN